jgi:hypothetical protein
LLNQLGNVVSLEFLIEKYEVKAVESRYESEWRTYNPRKLNNPRFGLSLTSLDGKLGGIDLDSIGEFNNLNNTSYCESSFKTATKIVDEIPSIKNLLSIYGDHVSRSHMLRLDRGGYFPPHRDTYPSKEKKTFRLFSVLSSVSFSHYHFILDGILQKFNPYRVYYINTQLEHSVISYIDGLTLLVVNIDENLETLKITEKFLSAK